MVVNKKPTGRTVSMPAGLALGGAAALAVTMLGCVITAWLVHTGNLPPEHTGYGIMVLLAAAAWTAATVAWKTIRRQKTAVCLLSGVVYYGILLAITALFFGGQYQGAGETALMIFCGCSLRILMSKPGKMRAPQRKFRIRNG